MLESWGWVLGLKKSAPLLKTPLGITITPPPLSAAKSITFCMAAV
jgi:hypothetical protein